MSLANKISYLGETKEEIRKGINKIGGGLSTSDTFRSYADKLEEIYDSLPKVEETDVEGGTLDGTIKGGLDITLKGNTSQYTTNGNQVVNFSDLTIPSNSVVYTFTNDLFIEKANGGSYNFSYFSILDSVKNNAGKTIKFGYDSVDLSNFTGGTTTIIQLVITNNGSNTYKEIAKYSNATTLTLDTYTIPNDTSNITKAQIQIFTNNSTTANNTSKIKITKPLIYYDNNNQYEEYTGNQPSPSSLYPQPINVVSGDNEVVVCGKNLFDKSTITSITNGTITNDVITSNAISTGYGGVSANINSLTLEAGTYYISLKMKLNSGTASVVNGITRVGTAGTSTITTTISPNPSNEYQIYKATLTCTDETSLTNIGIQLGGTNTNAVLSVKDIMISPSSDTTYEPYQSQTYPINLGVENLFDKDTETDNYFINASGEIIASDGFAYSSLIPVLHSTYTLSGTSGSVSGVASSNKRVHGYDSDGNWVEQIGYITIEHNVNYSYTFTISNPNIKSIRISILANDVDVVVEKGNKINHINSTPIELCKIGDYQDYFTKNSGKNLLNNNDLVLFNSNKYISTPNYSTIGTIKVEPNTTYSFITDKNILLPDNNIYEFDINNENKITATKSATNNDYYTIISFTTSAATHYISFYRGNGNGTAYNSVSDMVKAVKMMFIKGNDYSLPYEPYGTGQWCKYNAIGKVVYDENTSFAEYNTTTHSFVKYNPFEIKDKSSYSTGTKLPEIFSNYYTSVKWNDFLNGTAGLTLYYANNTLQIRLSSDLTTISDYQNWLSTHNVELLYPLATPYLSLIEDTTLIGQLDNLEYAMSYEGTTNIGQVNNDKPFIMDLKAILDWRNGGE